MKFTIQKKLLVLIALLSLAVIVASVLISARMYAISLEQNMKKLCGETAASLSENIESDHNDFMSSFKSKIEEVYLENREVLEEASEREFESFEKREEFYSSFTEGIFPPKDGFGLSYEMLVFKTEYSMILNQMDILSYAGGLDIASVFFYDREHGNIVYLIDRQPEGSTYYNFPASVTKPWNEPLKEAILAGNSAACIDENACYGLEPVGNTGDGVYVLFARLNTGIRDNVRLFSLYVFVITLGATLLIGLVVLLFANRLIVRNVRKLTEASLAFTSEIHGGAPEKVSAAITSNDEIGELSDKFDLMQDSILGYISSLAEQTSREEMMKAELNLAARIQSESLPKGGLRAGAAEVESFLKPAREVGGDFYDYFMLDESRLFFCLADVSGKGVPASLFMMRTKELIKAGVREQHSLHDFAFRLNNELCSGNEENVFITAFFGILDTESGRLSFLRAGHEQPFLKRGNEVEKLGEESNFVLGVFEDAEFLSDEIQLETGDVLLMFTDGLNEGINEKGEEFGYERISEALRSASSDITGALYKALTEFCGEEEQFDDVTMLLLSCGKAKRFDISDPSYDDITTVTDSVLNELQDFSEDRASEVGLIIDEIMNNQISYAFSETDAPMIRVVMELSGERLKLCFEDNGTAFDPLSDVTKESLEASEGGYGLMLVKSITEEQYYERSGSLNRLTVLKNMNS